MLDVFSGVNAELAGVIAIGIVLANIVNKGFVCNDPNKCCQVFTAAATHQATTDADIFLQSPTPSDQSTTGSGNLPPPGPGQIYA